MSGITSDIESIINDLEAANSSLQSIVATEYYKDGLAKGQVGMFSIAGVRVEELIGHYARLQEYVTYAGETFVEMDHTIGKSIAANEKK